MTNYYDIGRYLVEGDADQKTRAVNWAIAIGLQQVDGLTTSEYLRDVAQRNIEGTITNDEVHTLINNYYAKRTDRQYDQDTIEADKVSVNINKILSEQSFVFSPAGLISVHRRIFEGVFPHAGQVRDYNITKKEWILDGDTVLYAPATEILPSLEYDFGVEKKYSYRDKALDEIISHLVKFTSGIWQIHPFREGNTRATAIYIIKYLRSLGYNVGNQPFAENSWFFRNALVRANINNREVEKTDRFLLMFFENLLAGTKHELKNRITHIRYKGDTTESDRPGDRPTDQVKAVVRVLRQGPMSREAMMEALGLKHVPSFRKNYLQPALKMGLIERTIPDNPTHPAQQYRLTAPNQNN